MIDEFRTTRMVEFSETDMAGIVHFANFFRYMEAASRGSPSRPLTTDRRSFTLALK